MKKIISLIVILVVVASQSLVVCATDTECYMETECNDDFDTADSFTVYSARDLIIYGVINHDDTIDMYKFTASKSGKIRIIYKNYNTQADLVLYDESKNCIKVKSDAKSAAFTVELDRNDYIYLSVNSLSWCDYNEPYTLSVEWLETN